MPSFENEGHSSLRLSWLDSLCSSEDILNLALEENPPSKKTEELKTDLMRHQLQALKWMLALENPVLPESTNDPPIQVGLLNHQTASYAEVFIAVLEIYQ